MKPLPFAIQQPESKARSISSAELQSAGDDGGAAALRQRRAGGECCPLLPSAARRPPQPDGTGAAARARGGGHRPCFAARPHLGMPQSKGGLYGPEPNAGTWLRGPGAASASRSRRPMERQTDGWSPRSLHLCRHSAGLSPGSVWDGASLRLC